MIVELGIETVFRVTCWLSAETEIGCSEVVTTKEADDALLILSDLD